MKKQELETLRQKQLNGRLSLLEVNLTGTVYLWVGLNKEHLDSLIDSHGTTEIIFQLAIETMIIVLANVQVCMVTLDGGSTIAITAI